MALYGHMDYLTIECDKKFRYSGNIPHETALGHQFNIPAPKSLLQLQQPLYESTVIAEPGHFALTAQLMATCAAEPVVEKAVTGRYDLRAVKENRLTPLGIIVGIKPT